MVGSVCWLAGLGGTPPLGCDVDGCTVYNIATTETHFEASLPVFAYKIVTNPFNGTYHAQLEVTRDVGSSNTAGNFVKAIRYSLSMFGQGEEAVIYADGTEVDTPFTIDRANDNTLSISPKLDTQFPELARVSYFAEVFDYVFATQPPLPPGAAPLQPLSADVNWVRYFGDALIGLFAATACYGGGGLGCALTAAVSVAAIDAWQKAAPAVAQGPDVNNFLWLWGHGLCHGIEEFWILMTGIRPQIGCH